MTKLSLLTLLLLFDYGLIAPTHTRSHIVGGHELGRSLNRDSKAVDWEIIKFGEENWDSN